MPQNTFKTFLIFALEYPMSKFNNTLNNFDFIPLILPVAEETITWGCSGSVFWNSLISSIFNFPLISLNKYSYAFFKISSENPQILNN